MKKTLIIIILVVYIASIAVVNFFGLEIKVFDGTTYVESILCNTVTLQNENPIEITPSRYRGPNNDIPLFIFDFTPSPDGNPYTTDDESIIINPNVIQMNYEVLPHLADSTEVKFEFDTVAMEGVAVFHELSKSFIFLKPNKLFNVTIKATDGSNKSTTISIMGRIPNN
jgi:hypothetical protein